ncbi:phage tail assembly chaperone [Pseudomonas asiatica]|uniref:phage tail assembly chaperone n=1 Tax=Pseudomonas asiatica TaxID=2219225 RepID=UPI0025A15BC3|nr:phage tail assembly chaperone [Pseudomonas asiatica]WJM53929.1 phage tail assembly chaperone [Pseudomonas asiatica]
MTIFFSPGTGYFYDDQINSVIPDDAREITADLRDYLLAQQAGGRQVVADTYGDPVLTLPPPADPEVMATIGRQWRDAQLLATDGIVSRHRDELEAGVTTTLTDEQYAELQAYRRELRDWPSDGSFPSINERPQAPVWLAEQAL